jgi:CRP-like cAMP-binding protein
MSRFYIVLKGTVEIYSTETISYSSNSPMVNGKKRKTSLLVVPEGIGDEEQLFQSTHRKVTTIMPGYSFGELSQTSGRLRTVTARVARSEL